MINTMKSLMMMLMMMTMKAMMTKTTMMAAMKTFKSMMTTMMATMTMKTTIMIKTMMVYPRRGSNARGSKAPVGAEGVETMVAVGVSAKRQCSVQRVDRGRRGRHLPRFLSHLSCCIVTRADCDGFAMKTSVALMTL